MTGIANGRLQLFREVSDDGATISPLEMRER
jgi:hypothetical protein